MLRIVYISRATETLASHDVDAIVSSSAARNTRTGVTGMLWFDGIHFAQVVEGDDDAIRAVMSAIEKDARHTSIVVVSDAPTECRLYGNWAMVRADSGPESISKSTMLLGQAAQMTSAGAPGLRRIIASSLD